MKYQYAAITQKGVGKKKNEDRIMIAGNYISAGELQGEAEGVLLAVVVRRSRWRGFWRRSFFERYEIIPRLRRDESFPTLMSFLQFTNQKRTFKRPRGVKERAMGCSQP